MFLITAFVIPLCWALVAAEASKDCICYDNYADGVAEASLEISRVCGSDGKAYNTSCFAKCSGALPVHYGKCKAGASAVKLGACSKKCGDEYNPMCGIDRTVYANPCTAKCLGVTVANMGSCANVTLSKSCNCRGTEANLAPVCGKDGVTYGSQCIAKCAGAVVVSKGLCKWPKQSCNCTFADTQEVCSVQKWDYSNLCFARCVRSDDDILHWGRCFGVSNVQPNNWMRWASFSACGTDGKHYDNMCQAKCFGAGVMEHGGAPEVCPEVHNFKAPPCAKTGCF